MITREQIEAVRNGAIERIALANEHGESYLVGYANARTTVALTDLALRALDLEAERDAAREGLRIATQMNDEAEADRALGAKVRQPIVYAANDDGVTPFDVADRIRLAFCPDDQDADVWAVFQAIADALREEGGR